MLVKVLVEGTKNVQEVFIRDGGYVSEALEAVGFIDRDGRWLKKMNALRVTGVPVCTETPLRPDDILTVYLAH
jgi:hypothetical protein